MWTSSLLGFENMLLQPGNGQACFEVLATFLMLPPVNKQHKVNEFGPKAWSSSVTPLEGTC